MPRENRFLKVFLSFSLVVLALVVAAFVGYSWFAPSDITGPPDPTVEGSDHLDPVIEEEPEQEPTGLIPVEGPEFEPVTVSFTFNGFPYAITPEVANGVYYGAIELPRVMHWDPDLTEDQLMEDYYQRLTFDSAMDPAIEYVIAILREVRLEQDLDSAAYAELIIKYVQSIPYDHSRLETHAAGDIGPGDPRMPVQTLVDGTGDCDEKVMLAAALLAYEDFSVAALLFEEEAHMALGLKGEGSGYLESAYEFVELTGPGYVTEVPAEMVGGVILSSTPKVLKLAQGFLVYPQSAVDEVAWIIHARDTAIDSAEAKRAYIESTWMTDDQFYYERSLYEAAYVAANSFRVTVDWDGQPNYENPFMDRPQALDWLAVNYWWQ